jgi:hypothetical protein
MASQRVMSVVLKGVRSGFLKIAPDSPSPSKSKLGFSQSPTPGLLLAFNMVLINEKEKPSHSYPSILCLLQMHLVTMK